VGFAIFIAVLVFVGLLAILYFGYEEAEKRRAEGAARMAVLFLAHPPERGADEVVLLLERRIESDLQEAAAVLRRAAAGPRRV
jgi:cbb3-type cytochrome oxidase subunit 3